MIGEFDLIARYFAPLAAQAPGAFGLGNDAAVFPAAAGCEVVVTTDVLVEGVHFLADDPADAVARKVLRVNLSDLAAMGARPSGYVLGLALPKHRDEAWVAAFAAGLRADQDEFGIVLLGGDTVATPGPLTLTLTAFGGVPAGSALRRSTAGAGDLVYVSGSIGDGALGLRVRRGELAYLTEVERAALADRYRLPRPRVALGQALREAGLATAALDISDGLVADLGHIAAGSGLAAEIAAPAVPLSPAAAAALRRDPDLRAAILSGGDDYELLFTVAPDRAAAVASLAADCGVPLTRIGAMGPGAGVRVVDAAGLEISLTRPGWTHF